MGHVFISYSRKDKKYAERLSDDLREHGFDVWMDYRIERGSRWWRAIEQAIEECDAFVIVMSPSSEDSEWVEKEIMVAKRDKRPIFPLLLHGHEFGLLIDIQFDDVRVEGATTEKDIQYAPMPSRAFYEHLAKAVPPKDSTGDFKTPPAPEPTAPIVVQKRQDRKAWWAGALAGIVALALVGIVLLSGILNDRDDRESGNTGETRTDAPTETPTDTPTEEPTPDVVAQANTATTSPTNTDTETPRPTATYTTSPTQKETGTVHTSATSSPSATRTMAYTATIELSNTPSATSTTEDADNDGFVGYDDFCPDVAGSIEGCPPTATLTPTITDTATATATATSSTSPAHTASVTATQLSTDTRTPTNETLPTPTIPPSSTVIWPDGVGGEIVFSTDREGDSEIYRMDVDGNNQRNISQIYYRDYCPTWSPDGQRIAFHSNRIDNETDIIIMNADGSNQENITTGKKPRDPIQGADDDYCPSWSPDGKTLAITSWHVTSSGEGPAQVYSGVEQIYLMNVDGTNRRNISQSSWNESSPVWSPDGHNLLFVLWRDESAEIYLMDSAGQNESNMTENQGMDVAPVWSPDGTMIAFASDRSGNFEVYLMKVDGSGLVNLTNSPSEDAPSSWSPDGNYILFTSDRDGDYEVYVMEVDGSNQRNLSNSPSSIDQSAIWRPSPQ